MNSDQLVRGMIALALGGGLLSGSAASASVLIGTATASGGYQAINQSNTQWTSAMLGFGVNSTSPANALFTDIPHNATGIFQADATSYPTQFPAIVSLLTNGQSDIIWFLRGFNSPTVFQTSAGGDPEALAISPSVPVDFTGYTITHIRQVINSFSIGQGTLGGGNSTRVDFNITYQFYGDLVPTPSAVALAAAGSCVLVSRRRRVA